MPEKSQLDSPSEWSPAELESADELIASTEASPDIRAAHRQFQQSGFAIISSFIPAALHRAVGTEARELVERHAVRRDFLMEASGGTPRRMRNVQQSKIREHGSIIPSIYSMPRLRDLLSEIAGEPVFTCPYEPEKYVITCLGDVGDTHGWHWDDYSFALVWVVETPPSEKGGFVQCVADTKWNRRAGNPMEVLAMSSIQSYPVGSGHAYLMRTDTTLHRVYPLLEPGRRMIVNMAFASTMNLIQDFDHATVDRLWSSPDKMEPVETYG